MGSFLQEVDGFTPVIDVLAREVGLTAAAVYGVAWRYCQMRDGVCKTSQDTIAKHLGLSHDTVCANLQRLCELGYLEDTVPNAKALGRPHIYRDTGKVKIIGLLSVEVTENSSGGNGKVVRGVTEKPAGGNEEFVTKIVSRETTASKEEKQRFALFLEHVQPTVAPQTYNSYVRFLRMVDGGNGVLRVTAPDGPLDVCKHRLVNPLERAARFAGWAGIEFVDEEGREK